MLLVRGGDYNTLALESRSLVVEAPFELVYRFRPERAELPAAKVVVATLFDCLFVNGDVLVNFVKVVDWLYVVVAVYMVLEVVEELSVDGLVYVFTHRSDKTLDDSPVVGENFDDVIDGVKFCG